MASFLSASLTRRSAPGRTAAGDRRRHCRLSGPNYEGGRAQLHGRRPSLDASDSSDRFQYRRRPGEAWQVCVDSGYRGDCTTITDQEANLEDIDWNDRISPYGASDAGQGFRAANTPVNPTLELFAGTGYSGQRKLIGARRQRLRRHRFNAAPRAPARRIWEVCVSADFDDCRVVSASVPDLAPWDCRLMSSARPRFAGGGGSRAAEEHARHRPVSGRNTGGRSASHRPEPRSASSTTGTQSLRYPSSRWEVCDAVSYRGECRVVGNDARDLRSFGLAGVIRSVGRSNAPPRVTPEGRSTARRMCVERVAGVLRHATDPG